ncbi:MAG: acylneuraminate cytidylyltransferase family protein [Alphaproteobacteria bacterium]
MIRGLSVLAVVPARGGSKSIPRKNLAQVGGMSLVGRAAALAKGIAWIDRVIVSTDDQEIADEAVRHGAEAPFLRPEALSSDTASSKDMWRHAWDAAETHYGQAFDLSVLLEPTSPLRRAADIDRTVATMLDQDAAAAATVSRTPAHYTPHKTLTADDGTIGFYLPNGAQHSLRQTIPAYYHRNGACYALRRATLFEHDAIIERDCRAVVIDRHLVNIDDTFELELAAWLLARDSE